MRVSKIMTREEEIRQFIDENLLFGDKKSYGFATDLNFTGIISNAGFLELISFIEERFNLRFAEEDIRIENFSSIEKINAILDKKLQDKI